MLVEVIDKAYRQQFTNSPHPYISEPFIDQVKCKADRVVKLIEENEKVSLGLVAGIIEETLLSPFSAPFGGFHFRHENVLISDIDRFVMYLTEYASSRKIKVIKLTLPPDIYHQSFNTKMSNALVRNGFSIEIPEITNWIDLKQFTGEFSSRIVRQNVNVALRSNLNFYLTQDIKDKELAYQIIYENRVKFNRHMHMTFTDLLQINELWPVDFFLVKNTYDEPVASAIFYRGHEKIVQGIFWGDNDYGRCCRAMDFLAWKLWNHYKGMDYTYIDLGTSSICGMPNDGLIRFKENHDCTSALRFSFKWLYEPSCSS
jgi:hypothetical protein